MAFGSFREFVEALDHAGELRRVSEPIATELEATVLADREMKKPGGGQALLLEKPTVNGKVSQFPPALNTMGSTRRMAMILGVGSLDELKRYYGFASIAARRYGKRLQGFADYATMWEHFRENATFETLLPFSWSKVSGRERCKRSR